jgi:hypothetical protein
MTLIFLAIIQDTDTFGELCLTQHHGLHPINCTTAHISFSAKDDDYNGPICQASDGPIFKMSPDFPTAFQLLDSTDRFHRGGWEKEHHTLTSFAEGDTALDSLSPASL